MEFEFKIVTNKPPETVFAFFRDVDKYAARKGSIVPEYIKATQDPVRVGTRYLEVVQVMPFVKGKVRSELVDFEPNRQLGYKYVALGMDGELTYQFDVHGDGTQIKQRQSLRPSGLLRLFRPFIRAMFSRMASSRLSMIKKTLENGVFD